MSDIVGEKEGQAITIRALGKDRWEISHGGAHLGMVIWYEPWKRFVFYGLNSPYRSSQLEAITLLIKKLEGF